jgi:hypothetical protein
MAMMENKWTYDRCTEFDNLLPEMAATTPWHVYCDGRFVLGVERTRRADKMLPKLIDALNKNNIEVQFDS